MFETSVVRAQAAAARGRYSLLTISLMAHSAVIVGALAVSVATVDFPRTAPDEVASAPVFMPVQIPPPLGTPDGGRHAEPQPQQQPATPPPPVNQITAPPTVPETVTPVQSTSISGTSENTGPSTGTTEGPIGVPWGTDGSVGDLNAPPVSMPAAPPEQKIYEAGGEVKAPQLIRRVEPTYPPALQKMRLSGTVVLRCIIDKNGNVRDAKVVYSSHQAFADAVVKSLDGWRYKPASMRGDAVDCYLDLTVNFGVR